MFPVSYADVKRNKNTVAVFCCARRVLCNIRTINRPPTAPPPDRTSCMNEFKSSRTISIRRHCIRKTFRDSPETKAQ